MMKVKGGKGGFTSYLAIFAESLGVHLLLKSPGGQILTGPVGLRGLCRWMCERGLSPCREICLKPVRNVHREDVLRIKRCPLGFLTFTSPLIYRKKVVGYLLGGGTLPSDGYLPSQELLRDLRLTGVDCSALTSMASGNVFRPAGELSALLGGVKKSLQIFAGTLRLKSAAQRRINQVEGLFASLEAIHPGASLKESIDSILNSLSIFFSFEAALVAVPRPLVPGHYFLSTIGDPSILPGRDGENARDGFPNLTGGGVRPAFIDNLSLLMDAGFPAGVRSAWFFPIALAGDPEGILAIVNPSLAREDIRIIRGYTNSLAQSMRIFRLERSEEAIMDERAFLLSLIRELTGLSDRDSIYDIFLSKACSITGAEKGSLMIMGDDGELSVTKTLGQEELVLRGFKVKPGEGIAGRAFLQGSAIWAQDLGVELAGVARARPRYKTDSFISLPLFPKTSPPGVLNISDKSTGYPFTRQDLDRVKAISEHTLMAVERAYFQERVRIVASQAATDHLTGLATRRHLMEVLDKEIARCKRHGRSMALIMVDVDRFKEYNDLNGHLAGDEALKVIAAVLRQSVRAMDLACRYGGEEFCLVLTDAGRDEAMAIAERIRSEVENTRFPGEERMESGTLTLSLGVASFPGSVITPEEILHTADVAMYAAKRDGRNRVRWARDRRRTTGIEKPSDGERDRGRSFRH
jgi:diguanylate cyclase (GGDEF)-like protein